MKQLNRRTRLVVRPVVALLHRRGAATGRPKRAWEMRVEGCLWRFAGNREMSRLFRGPHSR